MAWEQGITLGPDRMAFAVHIFRDVREEHPQIGSYIELCSHSRIFVVQIGGVTRMDNCGRAFHITGIAIDRTTQKRYNIRVESWYDPVEQSGHLILDPILE